MVIILRVKVSIITPDYHLKYLDLYDAYKDGADTTVKLKGYKSLRWKQSPSLAILDKVRSGSVKDND